MRLKMGLGEMGGGAGRDRRRKRGWVRRKEEGLGEKEGRGGAGSFRMVVKTG